MNRRINEKDSKRIVNLDFLRGLFIILAMNQHFAYYLNMWYVEYFRDSIALGTTYQSHLEMIGKNLPIDVVTYWLAKIFTPWVSQIYLTMAAFNLGKYSQDEMKNNINEKIKTHMLILTFFIAENLIVAPNLGQGISIYPIMLWMIILTILSLAFRFFGVAGIVCVAFVSMFRFIIPIELISGFFEHLIKYKIHPGFEYDAKVEYFILSGCMGYLIGHVYYFKNNYRSINYKIFILLGFLFSAPYLFWGNSFEINIVDVFATEHSLSRSMLGSFFILGVQALVISAFLWLEERQVRFNIRVINWIGINSILVFAFHRIIFVKIIAPLSTLIHAMMNERLSASTIMIYIYISLTVLICYLLQRSPILKVILKK